MIRFCYSPDGNYNLQTLPYNNESFVIDKRNQKLRLFNAEDFYFSVLDSSYIDSSNPSVGLSMLGANRLYKELDLLGQVFDNYVNENDTDISTINEHLVISDGSIIKTNSSVSDLESRIGQFNFNKNYIYAVNSSDGDSELDIADGEGNVIVRLNDGHVQTKHFDSSWVLNEIDYIEENAVMNALIDTPNADLDVVDPSGNVILRLNDGHIQTKNFNSVDCSVLNSNFITLNENVNTYKNSVTSLQEDYRSYKVQIDTDFTNFKNNVIVENSSFRERFENYWVECEEVVTAAMADLNLQVQTLDSSVKLAISDISNRLDALDSSVNLAISSILSRLDALENRG